MFIWLGALGGLAVASEVFQGHRYYFGDMHAHTGVSGDGCSVDLGGDTSCGAAADLVAIARDNGLDFFVSTDHTNGLFVSMPGPFTDLRDSVTEGNDPSGGFVTLFGAEIDLELEGGQPIGHKTLVLFGDNDALGGVDFKDTWIGGDADRAIESCSEIWDWAESLQVRAGPLLLIPHHPALIRPMVTDWSCHDERFSPVVEVYSRHGDSLGGPDSYDPPWSGSRSDSTVHAALRPDGYDLRLGFVGGTDSHDTAPGAVCALDNHHTNLPYGGGLTVVVLDEDSDFDRQAIYDALVARRTYATSGPMIPVSVSWQSGGARLGGLGDTISLPPGQPLEVRVSMPEDGGSAAREVTLVGPVGRYSLVEQEDGLWAGRLEAEAVEDWHYLDVTVDGRAWYGLGLCHDGGEDEAEHLWISPSLVVPGPPDWDGDGVSLAEGDCDDGDAAVAPDQGEICLGDIDEDCDGLVDARDPDCDIRDPPAGRADGAETSAGPAEVLPPRTPDLVGRPSGCGLVLGSGRLGLLLSALMLASRQRRSRQ